MKYRNNHFSLKVRQKDLLDKMNREVIEGVSETPQGKFVVRIRLEEKNKRIVTISQHETYKEAEEAYEKAINP